MPIRNVLFLVSDFAPLTSVGRIRTQKLCKFLPAAGWRTSVLTFEPPPGTLTDPDLLAEIPPGTKVYRVPCPQPVEAPVRLASRLVRRIRSGRAQVTGTGAEDVAPGDSGPPDAGGGWFDRVSRWVDGTKRWLTRSLMIPDEGVTGVGAMARAAADLIRRQRIEVVVASVPGFSPWLAAVLAGRRTGVPVVVDYRDLWHGDVLRTWIGPLRTRLELALERWALSQSTAVVTVSDGKTRYVRGLDPRPDRRSYTTIYNGFDEDDLLGVEPTRPAGDDGRLLMLYAGRLYKHRRADPLLESIGRLASNGVVRRDKLRVRLFGLIEQQQRERIARVVSHYGLEDVVDVAGYVTRRDSLAAQLGADALILIVDPGETSDGVLPGKITEYIGLGRFVLAVCPPGEARNVLTRYGPAAWASANDPEALDAALLGMIERWRRDPLAFRSPAANRVVPSRRDNAVALAAVLDQCVRAHRPAERNRPLPAVASARWGGRAT